jgi:hypothetical protein
MGVFAFCTTGGVKRPKERCNESRTINWAPYGAKTKEKPAEMNRRDIVARVPLGDGRATDSDIRSGENGSGAAVRYKLRGRKRRVRNRNLCSRSSARCHHLSIQLLCQRFDHAGTKSSFRLSEHAVRFTGAIVGDRKLPICS